MARMKRPSTFIARLATGPAARQLFRFCGVGTLCLGTTAGGLAALHELAGMNYLVAYVLSFCLGNLLGYLLNGRHTFGAPVSPFGGMRYLSVNTALLVISTVLMKILVETVHVWYMAACFSLAVATTPFSFLLHKRFSYSAPARPAHLLPESPN